MHEHLLVYQARLSIYALLQRLYQDAPDAALLEWLIAAKPFADFPVALDDDGTAALRQLDSAATASTLDALRADFRRLYVGPGPMDAPPWESVYRNEEHLLFDKHTLQVRAIYARHGVEFVRLNQMPEDALSIELEFMRLLTERLIQAVESGDATAEQILIDEQAAFLKKHLLIWTPTFIMRTRQYAQTPFYSALADVLRAFLAWDEQTLALLRDSSVDEPVEAPRS
jgi:TorA maturation chaperone TorD